MSSTSSSPTPQPPPLQKLRHNPFSKHYQPQPKRGGDDEWLTTTTTTAASLAAAAFGHTERDYGVGGRAVEEEEEQAHIQSMATNGNGFVSPAVNVDPSPLHAHAQSRPPIPAPTARRSISGPGTKPALPIPPRSISSSSTSSSSPTISTSTPLPMTTSPSSSVPVVVFDPSPNPKPNPSYTPPPSSISALRPPTPPMGRYVLTRSTSLVTRALPTPPTSPTGGRAMSPRSGGGGSMSISGGIGVDISEGVVAHGRSQSQSQSVGVVQSRVIGASAAPPPSSFALRAKSSPLPVPPRQPPPQPPQQIQQPPPQPPQPQQHYQPLPPPQPRNIPQSSPMDWDSASSISSSSSSLYTTESEFSSSSSSSDDEYERTGLETPHPTSYRPLSESSIPSVTSANERFPSLSRTPSSSSRASRSSSGSTERTISRTPSPGPGYGLVTPLPLPVQGGSLGVDSSADSFFHSQSPEDDLLPSRSESPTSSLAPSTTTFDTDGSGSSVWTPQASVSTNVPFSLVESRGVVSFSSQPQAQPEWDLGQTKRTVEPLAGQKKPMTMGEIQALLQREKEALVQGRLAGGAGEKVVDDKKMVDPWDAEKRIYDAATAPQTKAATTTLTKKTLAQASSTSGSGSSFGSSVSSVGPAMASGSGRLVPLRYSSLGVPTPWSAALGPTSTTPAAAVATTTGTSKTTTTRTPLPNLSLIDLDSPVSTGLPTALFMSPPVGLPQVVPNVSPPPFSSEAPPPAAAAGGATSPPLLKSPGIDVSAVDPGLLGVLRQLEGQGFEVRAVGVGGAGVRSPPFSPPPVIGDVGAGAVVEGGGEGGVSGGPAVGSGGRVQMQRGLRGLGRVPTYDESEFWAREQSQSSVSAVTVAGETVTSPAVDVQASPVVGVEAESIPMAMTSPVPNPPTIIHPSSSRPGRSQVETSIAEVWFLKTITFKGKEYRIVTQNYNGPCSFIAICNILILREQIRVEPLTRTSVSYEFLSMLVADFLLSSSSSGEEGSTLSVDEALSLLPLTQKGLDLSPIFTSHTLFKPCPALRLFQLCGIELVHGWVVDPDSGEEAEVLERVGDYDSAVGLVVEVDHLTDGRFLSGLGGLEGGPGGLEEDEVVVGKVKDAITIQTFLSTHPTQLTYWGLFTLATECKGKGFQALFRNEHLSVVYDGIYCLVTDDGYLEEGVIWERMEDVDRGVFVGDFTVPVGGRSGATGASGSGGGGSAAGAAAGGSGRRMPLGGNKTKAKPKDKAKDKDKDKDCVIC